LNKIQLFATSYIKKGFSVIPIGINKRPLIPSWKKYQETRATEAELLGWLKQYPEMQLGIITGKISGLVVVDVDDYKDGFGMKIKLAETRMVKTGSGGTHYYYKYPKEGISNSADAVEKWDVRGEGGYVVAPPSRNEKGDYAFLNKLEMAELPKEILELAKKKKQAEIKPIVQKDFGGSIFDQLSSFDCRTRLDMLSGKPCVNGEIYSFRNRAGGGYLIDIGGEPANCWITPDGMIGSGSKGASGKTGSPTLNQWLGWFGHSKQEKAKIIKEVFGFSDKPFVFEKSESVNSYTWGLDCIDEQISTLKKKTLTILLADENAGKSTFSFFFARQNAKKYGHKVVYFSLESTKEELFQMVAFNYAGTSRIDERDEKYLEDKKYLKKIEELENQRGVEIIGRTAAKITGVDEIESTLAKITDVDLLILDNLTCIKLEDGRYNENIAIAEIIQRLIGLSQKLNIPIVLVHHYNKKKTNSPEIFRGIHEANGSGAIKNLAHKVIQVARKRGSDLSKDEQAEFHIKEGKVRTRAGDNEFMVYYQNGTFYEKYQSNEIVEMSFYPIASPKT